MRAALAFLLLLAFYAPLASASDAVPAVCSAAPRDHTAADAVRAIAYIFYEPFASYPFAEAGLCLDPQKFQPLFDAFLHRPEDGISPPLESLCLNRPQPGALSLRWSFGPTPEAKLFVLAGQDEETVKSHDFWHVEAPSELVCSRKMELRALTFERDGGVDVQIDEDANQASIRIYGITVDVTIPGSKIPSFLTSDVGVDELSVDASDVFTAHLSAPLFNIPVEAVGDIGPNDSMSLEVLGFDFKLR